MAVPNINVSYRFPYCLEFSILNLRVQIFETALFPYIFETESENFLQFYLLNSLAEVSCTLKQQSCQGAYAYSGFNVTSVNKSYTFPVNVVDQSKVFQHGL